MTFHKFLELARRGNPITSVAGRAFLTVNADNLGRQTLAVRSRAFTQWFYDQCYSTFETIPTSQTFSAVCRHLEAQAGRDSDHCSIRVPLRLTWFGDSRLPDRILLDLANPDGQFVEISPNSWRVTSGPGVPFEISSATATLPVPEPPTADDPPPLDTLRTALNLGPADSPDWLRCLAWLLAALNPSGPSPILVLRGPSGCGKSLAGRILRSLVDPATSPFTPIPSTTRDLLTFARQTRVLAFDHISTLTPQIATTLCRLSSGLGVACREPGHTMPLHLWIKRPILLTVTPDWVAPPDLADRALFVTLPPLTPTTRRPEIDVTTDLSAVFPKILGALCTAVSRALAGPPPPTPYPNRHADILAWAQSATHLPAAQLCDALGAPPPPDPFVTAVHDLLSDPHTWSGTAADLLKLLHSDPSPNHLGARLNRSILPLADAGIDINFRRRHGGVRIIELSSSPDSANSSQLPHKRPFSQGENNILLPVSLSP